MSLPQNRVITFLLRNRAISFLVAIGIILITLGTFTNAVDSIITFVEKRLQRTSGGQEDPTLPKPLNLAPDATASASSTYMDRYPRYCNDADLKTEWSGNDRHFVSSDLYWLRLSFDTEITFSHVKLNLRREPGQETRLLTSKNGHNFVEIQGTKYVDRENEIPTIDYTFNPVITKHIQLNFRWPSAGAQPSVYEIEVYQPPTIVSPYAAEVVSFIPGSHSRNSLSNVIGPPDDKVWCMGVGGVIIVKFTSDIMRYYNGLLIHTQPGEDSNSVRVEGSYDGSEFVYIGTNRRHSKTFLDFRKTSLTSLRYVRLTDVDAYLPSGHDGFNLDAIEAVRSGR